jgi:hypothetical protein
MYTVHAVSLTLSPVGWKNLNRMVALYMYQYSVQNSSDLIKRITLAPSLNSKRVCLYGGHIISIKKKDTKLIYYFLELLGHKIYYWYCIEESKSVVIPSRALKSKIIESDLS